MPASLAVVKAYWDGAGRQRAISMWSIGSWGGSGLCSLFGGLMSENFGWRSIFFASIAVCFIGLWMMRGTPETERKVQGDYKFDVPGVLSFMVAMIAVQVVVTQGNRLGWTSPLVLGLIAVTLVFGALFLRIESRSPNAFFDFSLFKNATYTGATISNFLLNGVAGTLIVSLQLVQFGGNMSAQTAGMLTLGYAIAIIAFIRVPPWPTCLPNKPAPGRAFTRWLPRSEPHSGSPFQQQFSRPSAPTTAASLGWKV